MLRRLSQWAGARVEEPLGEKRSGPYPGFQADGAGVLGFDPNQSPIPRTELTVLTEELGRRGRSHSPRVAVVNKTTALTYWPSGSQVGNEKFVGGPICQSSWHDLGVVARRASHPGQIAKEFRQLARDADPRVIVVKA